MNQPEPIPAPTDTEVPPPIHRYAGMKTVDVQQFRDMERDSTGLEAIRAWWVNNDPDTLVGKHGGDAVAATLDTLNRLKALRDQVSP